MQPYQIFRRYFPFLLALLLGKLESTAQAPPALPQTDAIETCFPDTAGYEVLTVGPVGRDYSDLQLAIDEAMPGSVLVLDAGVRFEGSFSLPNKPGDGWIIITSSQLPLLPLPETRVVPTAATGSALFPTQQDAMPHIVSTNPAGLPCFRTMASAHHYRLVGLDIQVDTAVHQSFGLVQLGNASSAQNTLDLVPHHLVIDRCFIHGHTNATVMKAGVLLNCATSAVIDSHLSGFHSIGFDTYAIGCTNGPGPFKIINNFLEAAGENILFGGAAPVIPQLVPSDIEVRHNHFFKPFAWRVGHPDYEGKHWTIKNLFELKTGRRVLLDGNLFENTWADLPIGQSGYAILLTVRTEGGNAPQADVSDITITNNIVRHAGAGISLSGHDGNAASLLSSRIKIANNLFDDISGPAYGDGNTAGPNDGIFIKIGDPKEVLIDHNTVLQSGAITWAYDTTLNIALTNNIFHCFLSEGGYQGIYGPGFAQGGNGPMAAYFPGITDANQGFHQNVLIGGNPSKYSNYSSSSQNHFPATAADVQFLDYGSGPTDYHQYALTGTSPYHLSATDGSDIGVDMAALDAAMLASPQCATMVSAHALPPLSRIRIAPNPAHGHAEIHSSLPLTDAELVLFNTLGMEAGRFANLHGQDTAVHLAGLPAGLYFYALSQGGRLMGNGRLVVE